MVAALLGLALLDSLYGEPPEWRAFRATLGALMFLALPWRRVQPLEVVALVCTAASVAGALTLIAGEGHVVPEGAAVAVLIATYALVRWGSGREVAAGAVLVVVGVAVIEANVPPEGVLGYVLAAVFWLFPAVLGLTMRYRDAARLGRFEEARRREREHIARELHDTVAHHVSAIAVQAQAARVVFPSRPGAAADALRVIEEAASRTLVEMRTIVEALRDGAEATTAPARRVADIERLAGTPPNGPEVDVRLSGALDALAPSVEAGLYRLAQESITNARRHARHARRITVEVEGEADRVRLTVADDGAAGRAGAGVQPRFGLTGMAERAALLGGRLEAGPHPDGGWRVQAVLPKTGGVSTGGMA